MVNSKHAFWLALVFTILIFISGLFLGFFLEDNRANNIQIDLMKSEINLLDEQIKSNKIANKEVSCDLATISTFEFADKIYLEAQKLEKNDATNKFLDTLKIVHKRYDLLRMMVWDESKQIKNNCNSSFHTVVYLFNYDEKDLDIRAKQATFSRILTDLKEKNQNKILLIPIASNLDLSSVNLVKDHYDIKTGPAIIIDEKKVIIELMSLEDLEKEMFD